jgi:hypothetical protein
MGVFLFKRLLARQTKEGFWEDDRHHGPSARYGGLMLPSLAWMYRWTADEAFGDAARRLADFLASYAYPDSVSVGAFDGRNSNVLAYFPTCPGFELTPLGRAYAARAFGLWRDAGMLDDVNRAAQSTRDLARLAFYAADTCEYLSQFAAQPAESVAPAARLPIDGSGGAENHALLENHTAERKGPWVLALSSQNSSTRGVYRLERQSRIEIWHEQMRLLIGGGHNQQDWPIPHANVVLDNGSAGRSDFGAAAEGESGRISQHYYRPQVARSRVVDGTAELVLEFGHGTVRFSFAFPDARSARVQAEWDVRRVERLCLQLPLVIWSDAELWLDGQRQDGTTYGLHNVRRTVALRGGLFDSAWRLELPDEVPARVHYPLLTGVFHAGAERQHQSDPIQNPFRLALVSCQWTKPAKTGQASFGLALES